MYRKRTWGWLWGKLGLLFIFTQRQLLGLLHPARSRGRSRQDANLVHGYKWVKYSVGGEKGKMKVRKANKGKKDKNLLELV